MTEPDSISDDDRSVELSSIAAIFPEIKIDPITPYKASLDIVVKPSTPVRVCFQQQPHLAENNFPAILTPPTSVDASETGFPFKNEERIAPLEPDNDFHILSHFPPLCLEIELPEGYPADKAPSFHLETDPAWLPPSKLSQLLDDGKRLWEECGRDLVVYTYIDHLQQLCDTGFGYSDSLNGEMLLSRDLKIALLDFNNKAEQERFDQETFECGVCLEPKKGINCHRLLRCSHVFCISCLRDFYNSCITEGDIESVKCLSPGCGKETANKVSADDVPKKRKKVDRTLSPSELLQIPLEQETVQRFVSLKRKKRLEADKSTVYCPREWCQGAARSKKHPKPTDPMSDDLEASDDDEEEGPVFDPLGDEAQLPPVAERLAICEDCSYAFCCVCKKGWHGELVRCFPRRAAELTAEEKATEEYLRRYTSACPTCSAPCQKKMGCNHMICFKCDTHFCYLCSCWLFEENPYRHFNDPESQCYQKLWDLEGGDGIDPDGAEALHQLPAQLIEIDDGSDEEDLVAMELGQNPPPPAPVPPRVNHGAGGNGQRGDNDPAAQAAAAERQAQARAMAEVRRRPQAAAGREGQPAQHARPGLQRFLELVQNDREDEWDSDELDDDF
ncbi:RBR-type E3 ubiquitin transferase [Aspergillus saccharolyticus JOP 1030-1]|uniref:RBR-type E3 ubiquitin transferase n=1 Tax=Aspergillus saccharolyticus JOP 1030-1 TaxID=1450539 RepID=A0A318ZNA4_9EURO|nr:RING finger protein [Aspergillus saccharolyticus JOP 1030-1]PYH48165.1 RING finger protein [Aspergillus saccharolyticus JOP 1030-1]